MTKSNESVRQLIANPIRYAQAQTMLIAILVTDPRAPRVIDAIQTAVRSSVRGPRE